MLRNLPHKERLLVMKAFVTTKERLCNFLCVTVIVPNKYFDFQYVFLLITTACIEAKPPQQQVFFFCNFCANLNRNYSCNIFSESELHGEKYDCLKKIGDYGTFFGS